MRAGDTALGKANKAAELALQKPCILAEGPAGVRKPGYIVDLLQDLGGQHPKFLVAGDDKAGISPSLPWLRV